MKPSEIIRERAKEYLKWGLPRDEQEATFQAILVYLDAQEERIKFLENVVQQLSTKKLA